MIDQSAELMFRLAQMQRELAELQRLASLPVSGDISVNNATVAGDLTVGGGAPAAANEVISLPEGYGLFADNAGPGSADSRVWIDGPNGGAAFVGPRVSGEWFDLIRLRATTVNIDGALDVDGHISTGAYGASRRLIDSGTTAGARWLRFADGTMIQESRHSVTNQAINTAYGSLFIGSRAISFPVAFAAPPSVTVGEALWGTSASWGAPYLASATGFTIRFYDISSRPTGTSTVISWLAIGRWS